MINLFKRSGVYILATLVVVGLFLQVAIAGYNLYIINFAPNLPLFVAPSPQIVLTKTVKMGNGSSVFVRGTKCNLTEHSLSSTGSFAFIREKPTRLIIPQVGSATVALYPPGCREFVFENILPSLITTGTWHIEGNNIVTDPATGRTQTIGWFTESFEIIADK